MVDELTPAPSARHLRAALWLPGCKLSEQSRGPVRDQAVAPPRVRRIARLELDLVIQVHDELRADRFGVTRGKAPAAYLMKDRCASSAICRTHHLAYARPNIRPNSRDIPFFGS